MHNNIRDLRTDRLMTQKELVARCNLHGFDVPTLSRVENGKMLLTEEQERALMLHLRCTKDELYGEWKEIPVNTGNKERIEEPPMQVLELVSYLKPGRKNAISRFELRRKMDISDRMLRRTIAVAADYGYAIGNLSDGKGYFLVDDESEAKAYISQETSRAWEIMAKLTPFYAILEGE